MDFQEIELLGMSLSYKYPSSHFLQFIPLESDVLYGRPHSILKMAKGFHEVI